jgi:hypothetical protein
VSKSVFKNPNPLQYVIVMIVLIQSSCTSGHLPVLVEEKTLNVTGTSEEGSQNVYAQKSATMQPVTKSTYVPQISALPTPTLNFDTPEVLYFFSSDPGIYGYVDLSNHNNKAMLLFPRPAPGGWRNMHFANFNDSMYFSVNDPDQDRDELRISNLSLEGDLSPTYLPPKSPFLFWTPNDKYLVSMPGTVDDTGFIYNNATGMLDEWPYVCDRVAISPISGNLATWCSSRTGKDISAILEWDGEIQIIGVPPTQVIVEKPRQVSSMSQVWGWSSDGKEIAFFDPQGNLNVADASGSTTQILEGSIDWSMEVDYKVLAPLDDSIEWAGNADRLLVHTRSTAEAPCPASSVREGELRYENPPCWQVVDLKNKKVIWSLSDFIEQSTSRESRDFFAASISSSGRYLALASIHDIDRELAIIDIDNNKLIWVDHAGGLPDAMRWGNDPKIIIPPDGGLSDTLTTMTPTPQDPGLPSISSADSARQAYLSGDIRWLNELILPGSQLSIEQDEPLLWGSGWCSLSEDALENSMDHVRIQLFINDHRIDNSYIASRDYTKEEPNNFCKGNYILISHWPAVDTILEISYEILPGDYLGW